MAWGVNFLPTEAASYTLNNASISNGVLSIGAGGSAFISITPEMLSELSENVLLVIRASNYSNNYDLSLSVTITAKIFDMQYIQHIVNVVEQSDGAFITELSFPTTDLTQRDLENGYVSGGFLSIDVRIDSEDPVSLSSWELHTTSSESADDPNAVKQNEYYYGVKITKENGLVIDRSDGNSKVILNSDVFSMQALVNGVMTDRVYFDSLLGDYVFNGILHADVIEAIKALTTQNLYADKATISQLTVDQLDTSTKVKNYLLSSTEDVNYVMAKEQTIAFITASTDGAATEAATDRNGDPLYWIDETHKVATTDETAYPVTQYVYTEMTKLVLTFETDDEDNYVPKIILGTGSGTGDRQKAKIYKATDGLYIDYYKSDDTTLRIMMGEEGMYINGENYSGVRNMHLVEQADYDDGSYTTKLTKPLHVGDIIGVLEGTV